MDACIVMSGVDVRIGPTQLLDNVSLTVHKGRIVGLLGPSGAGKSTLLKCLLGLQSIHGGTAKVLDLPVGQSALRRQVGYMSQAKGVYVDLSVEDNLRYFARLMGSDRQQVESLLEKVELTRYRHQRVGRLSGGQAARVSLAIALLGQPKLLLLDEPTVGLDPVLRQKLWQLFRQLVNEGVSVVVSSHVMDEADQCDDIIFIRQGKVLISDKRQSVLVKTKTSNMEAAFLKLSQEAAYE